MNSRPKTLVAGWFGNGNVGDDALLVGMVRAIHGAVPDWPLTFFSANPSSTAVSAGVRATRRSLPIRGSQRFVEIAAMLRHGFYVLGGGGLLKDMGGRPGNCHTWLRPMRAAQVLGKRTMTYAIGVESVVFEESRQVIRSTLGHCDLLTVRDPGSRRLLESIGVQGDIVVTADPALLLGAISGPLDPDSESRVRVVVNLRNWFTDSYTVHDPALAERVHCEVARALDSIIDESRAQVTFLPFRAHAIDDDRLACRDVLSRMRRGEHARIAEVPSPMQAMEHYQAADFSIGMRLHSTILSAAATTPFAAIGYMAKVSDFLEHVGLPDALVAGGDAPEGSIERRIVETFHRRVGARAHLAQRIPVLRKLALFNGAMLVAIARRDAAGLASIVAEAAKLTSMPHPTHAS